MESVSLFVAMAAIVQYLVDRIKGILPDQALNYLKPPFWSIQLSLLLTLAFELDFFEVFDLYTIMNPLTKVLTALVISAGADPMHNLFAKLREWRNLP